MLKFLLALMILLMPLTVDAKSEDLTIDGDHGKLAATLQTPDAQKKFPLVILCHGFNADKEYPLLKSLADALETRGIASIRFDFNGHGKSDGEFQNMTIPNEIVDARKVFDYVRKLPSVTNISIAGHSQGGVVASMLAGELGTKINSVVLLASSPGVRENALRGEIVHVRFDAHNPPEYIEINTPYGKRKIGREYILTAQKLPIYETSEKFTGSVLIIHGTGDATAPYTYSLFYKKYLKHGELELLEGVGHSFKGHESRVVNLAADWLARHMK